MTSCYLEIFGTFSFLDPVLALSLGIDEQGKSWCLRYNYTILNRQVIVWQTLNIPLGNLQMIHPNNLSDYHNHTVS